MSAATNELAGVADDGPIVQPKPLSEVPHFDITAMIDLVFLMNLYFLVKMLTVVMGEVDLPKAQRGVAAEMDNSVVIFIVAGDEGSPPGVSLGTPEEAKPLSESSQEEIRAAVERGVEEGKKTVVIKAEKNVLHRYVSRVATAASQVPDVKLQLAVMEYNE